MEIKTTNRGFQLIKFSDSYGVPCSLQKSSAASQDKIWLGCDNAEARMHLTRQQVAKLLPYLERFVASGDLE